MTDTLPNDMKPAPMPCDTAEPNPDVWDARQIPGIACSTHRAGWRIDFTTIPTPLRPAVQAYIRYRLGIGIAWHTCLHTLYLLRAFTDFWIAMRPDATGLQALTRSDVEAFFLHLRGTNDRQGKQRSVQNTARSVGALKHFLAYLERTRRPEAPAVPVAQLIWPGDAGRPTAYRADDDVRVIPTEVLDQLAQYLHKLPMPYMLVVLLLWVTGWRISDIVDLRLDCLEQHPDGWWLSGRIVKTRISYLRIPIADDVAQLVASHIALVRLRHPESENPHGFLFPASSDRRQGLTINAARVQGALNKLATRYGIRDGEGAIYRFFRHSFAVNAINNGMPLEVLKHWLGHRSADMTLVYARLAAETVRRGWEAAYNQGAFHVPFERQPGAPGQTSIRQPAAGSGGGASRPQLPKNKPQARNTAGMAAHVQRAAAAKRQRVLDAIAALQRTGAHVDFPEVAKRAGVSRSYLYADAELSARIKALREEQPPHATPSNDADVSVPTTIHHPVPLTAGTGQHPGGGTNRV